MIKGSVQEEDITIVNIYAPNIRALQYIRQTLTDVKGEYDINTTIIVDFNTPFTPMDRLPKQIIKKKTQSLKWYIRWDESQWYLQDIPPKFRKIHLLLKCTWNILQDRPNLGSQISKFKKIEIISSTFSDPNTMRLDINYKKKNVRNTNT